jgi:hypothetical protein
MGGGGEFLDGLEPGVAATRLQLLQRPPNHVVDRSKGSVALANPEFVAVWRVERSVGIVCCLLFWALETGNW